MIKYTKEELTKILEDHKLWLNDKTTGKKADLIHTGLSDAILFKADLRDTNLIGVNLDGVDLSYAELYKANMGGVDLICAKLRHADLRYAILSGVIFTDTRKEW